ncbi:MAG: inositol monophosphatase family protein [Planctomycetota bacterium]
MLDFLDQVLRGAGAELMKYYGKLDATMIDFKGRNDLQTQADLASEKYVTAKIREKFPEDSIYAEEGGTQAAANTSRWWFIDPLDGTTNFAHALPIFAVSVGVWENGAMRYGGVFAPYINEMFLGELGKGATLNGEPISVSHTPDLQHAVIGTGFTYKRAELTNNNLQDFAKYCVQVRGIRRLGSASMDMCYVGCGRLDAYWEAYLGPFDSAAASVIVHEAGGKVTDYNGGEDWLFGENVLVTNGKLHGAFEGQLAALDPGTTGRFARPQMD